MSNVTLFETKTRNIVDQILCQGQRLRNSMVASILNNDPFSSDVLSSSSKDLTTQKSSKLSDDDKNIFEAYFRGENLSKSDEKKALDSFRQMSSSDLNEFVQKTSCTCSTCREYQSKINENNVPPLNLNRGDYYLSSRLNSGQKNNYENSEFENEILTNFDKIKYADSVKVGVHSLTLTNEGLRRLFGTVGDYFCEMPQQQNNTYFIDYSIPEKIAKKGEKSNSKVDSGLRETNHVRICSRKVIDKAVAFKQISYHDISSLENVDLNEVVVKFEVSSRNSKQKNSNLLGSARFTFSSFLGSKYLTSNQQLAITMPNGAPILLGNIKVSFQLGCGKFYGKELTEKLREDYKNNIVLSESISTDSEGTKQNFIEQDDVENVTQRNTFTLSGRKGQKSPLKNQQSSLKYLESHNKHLENSNKNLEGSNRFLETNKNIEAPIKDRFENSSKSPVKKLSKIIKTRQAVENNKTTTIKQTENDNLTMDTHGEITMTNKNQIAMENPQTLRQKRLQHCKSAPVSFKRNLNIASKSQTEETTAKKSLATTTANLGGDTTKIPEIYFGFVYVPQAKGLANSPNSYFTCELFGLKEIFYSRLVHNSADPTYDFQETVPFVYDDQFLENLRENYSIFEFWTKNPDGTDFLIGISKISTHQLYVAYRNPLIIKYLLANELPVVCTDWWEPICDPLDGKITGHVQILLALGTQKQILNLKQNRGFDLQIIRNKPIIKQVLNEIQKEKRVDKSREVEKGKRLQKNAQPVQKINLKVDKSVQYDMDENNDSETSKANLDKTVLNESMLNGFLAKLMERGLGDSGANMEMQKVANLHENLLGENKNSLVENKNSLVENKNSLLENKNLSRTSDLLDSLERVLLPSTSGQPAKNEPPKFFRAHVIVESAMHLPSRKKCKSRVKNKKFSAKPEEILPSAYVTFETVAGDLKITPVVAKSANPNWDFRTDVQLPIDLVFNNQKRLILKVWRKCNGNSTTPNLQTDLVIGFAALDLTVLKTGMPTVQGWFNITDLSGKCNGQIKVIVTPLENICKLRQCENKSCESHITNLFNNDVNLCENNEKADEPSELLSRALKRKFIELDEITQRLRLRLSKVTNDESDGSNDDVADEFERDINTLCVEDDYDMVNFDDKGCQGHPENSRNHQNDALLQFSTSHMHRNDEKTNESLFKTTDSSYKTNESLYKTTDSSYKTNESLYKTTDSSYKTNESLYKTTDSSYKTNESLYKTTDNSYKTKDGSCKTNDSSNTQTNDCLYKINDGLYKINDGLLHKTNEGLLYKRNEGLLYKTNEGLLYKTNASLPYITNEGVCNQTNDSLRNKTIESLYKTNESLTTQTNEGLPYKTNASLPYMTNEGLSNQTNDGLLNKTIENLFKTNENVYGTNESSTSKTNVIFAPQRNENLTAKTNENTVKTNEDLVVKTNENFSAKTNENYPNSNRTIDDFNNCQSCSSFPNTSNTLMQPLSVDVLPSSTVLDKELLEGKQRISSLLEKLSLLTNTENASESFSNRYVSGCSISTQENQNMQETSEVNYSSDSEVVSLTSTSESVKIVYIRDDPEGKNFNTDSSTSNQSS